MKVSVLPRMREDHLKNDPVERSIWLAWQAAALALAFAMDRMLIRA